MAESERPTEEISSNGDGLVAEPRPVYGPEIPQQKEFFKIPARFGHVPVAEEPLGYDKERRFEGHPRIELPFQVVDVVKTGAERLGEVTELFPQGRQGLTVWLDSRYGYAPDKQEKAPPTVLEQTEFMAWKIAA